MSTITQRKNIVFHVHYAASNCTICRLKVTFIDKDGQESTFEVAEGDNLLDIAQSEDLEMEGGFPLPIPSSSE